MSRTVHDNAVLGVPVSIVAVMASAGPLSDTSIAVSVMIVTVSIALVIQWRSKRLYRRARQRDRDRVTYANPHARPALPEHPASGEYQCQECHAGVTVGPSGTEYGHTKGTTSGSAERCPRRPTSVDPHLRDGGSTETSHDRASKLLQCEGCDDHVRRSDADDHDRDGDGGSCP